jgi:hypothetical protein
MSSQQQQQQQQQQKNNIKINFIDVVNSHVILFNICHLLAVPTFILFSAFVSFIFTPLFSRRSGLT